MTLAERTAEKGNATKTREIILCQEISKEGDKPRAFLYLYTRPDILKDPFVPPTDLTVVRSYHGTPHSLYEPMRQMIETWHQTPRTPEEVMSFVGDLESRFSLEFDESTGA